MKTLKEKLKEAIKLSDNSLINEQSFKEKVVDAIYEEYEKQTLTLFLAIQQRDMERIREEKSILYQGLEFSLNNEASLMKHLLEDKTSKQAKDFSKYVTEENLAMMIFQMKAYFPEGTSEGASNNGKWFFDKFLSLLRKTKDKYLSPNGDSVNWAKMFNHEDYMKLILSKNEEV